MPEAPQDEHKLTYLTACQLIAAPWKDIQRSRFVTVGADSPRVLQSVSTCDELEATCRQSAVLCTYEVRLGARMAVTLVAQA